MESMIVKLVRVGKKVEEFEVSNNPTVGGLLTQAGVSYRPGCITINQGSVNTESFLEDGDTVYVGDPMKGNTPFIVSIVRIGNSEAVISLPCEPGTTVKALLNQLPEQDRAKFFKADGSDVYEYQIPSVGPMKIDSVIPTPNNIQVPVRLIMAARMKGN
jgi:sulfur carrier protein ThiS